MLGAGAGKHIHLSGQTPELIFIQVIELFAGQYPVGITQPEFSGNGTGRQGVVAGNHLHPNTGIVALFDSADSLLPGRIQQAHHSQQFSALFQLFQHQFPAAFRHWPARQCQHPQAFGSHFRNDPFPVLRAQRLRSTVGGYLALTHGQNPFRSAFEIGNTVAVMVVMQCGHEPYAGIEGNLIHPGPGGGTVNMVKFRLTGKHFQRGFHGVTMDRRLPVFANNAGVVTQRGRPGKLSQHPIAGDRLALPADPAVGTITFAGNLITLVGGHSRGHHHFVTGERAGLVGADDRYRTQGFDHRHPANHRLATGHLAYTNGKGNGKNGRQAFRNGCHREPHHRHEQLPEFQATERQAAKEDDNTGGDDNQRKPPRKPVHLFQQRSFKTGGISQQAGNAADFGMHTGTYDNAPGGARGHHGAGERHASLVAEGRLLFHRIGELVHRLGFARQDSFLNLEVVGFFQAKIGGHTVTSLQQHGITRYQLAGIHLMLAAGPDNAGAGSQHMTDSGQCLLGPTFLDEADQGLDNHHRQNHPGVDPVSESTGDGRCGQQYINQEIT